jgi:hypothetical protein
MKRFPHHVNAKDLQSLLETVKIVRAPEPVQPQNVRVSTETLDVNIDTDFEEVILDKPAKPPKPPNAEHVEVISDYSVVASALKDERRTPGSEWYLIPCAWMFDWKKISSHEDTQTS